VALFRIKNDIKTLWVDTSKGGQLEAEVEVIHHGGELEFQAEIIDIADARKWWKVMKENGGVEF